MIFSQNFQQAIFGSEDIETLLMSGLGLMEHHGLLSHGPKGSQMIIVAMRTMLALLTGMVRRENGTTFPVREEMG